MECRQLGRLVALFALVFAVGGVVPGGVAASEAAKTPALAFTTHAAFFSSETHQPKAIDPQVFVSNSSASAATGPQGIEHIAGFRPAFIDQDAGNTAVFNAKGEPLGFDLVAWLSAKGTVAMTPTKGGKTRITVLLSNLRPGGAYSLFENHFDQQPVGFTPLDGIGKANNFVASKKGTARISLIAPQMLTHANAVLLVYHSDKMFHGDQRGEIGINAHHQLIARVQE